MYFAFVFQVRISCIKRKRKKKKKVKKKAGERVLARLWFFYSVLSLVKLAMNIKTPVTGIKSG